MSDPFMIELKAARPGWQPPTPNDLAKSLLDKTEADITVLNYNTMV